jgi:hypothetical protein
MSAAYVSRVDADELFRKGAARSRPRQTMSLRSTIVSTAIPAAIPEDFVRSRFVPTVVYAREAGNFHTRLCVYNYFSEIFPEVKTGATIYCWLFDSAGRTVAHRAAHVGYRGQLQLDLEELGVQFEGTAALSMVPDTLPEFKHRGVATGYYAYYYDDSGHGDFSHELQPMRFEPTFTPCDICLVRPLLFPDTQIVVMNSYYGTDAAGGASEWSARLRSGRGSVLDERKMNPIPARGSVRLALQEIFPQVSEFAEREGAVAVELSGSNLHSPLTWVTVPGGDFNIHHFS